MATIDQVKTQLSAANTLGLTNLAAKGVTTTGLDTTYKIMEAIASITGGGSGSGGDSSGGPSFIPLDDSGTGFYWNGDTTGITDVVTVMEEEDTNIAFYKVLAIGENEDPDSKMYYDFIFSVGAKAEELFRVIPTVTSKNNAIWSVEGTPIMAYIVNTTEEVNGLTFPAKGLYLMRMDYVKGGSESASMHVTVVISGAMLKFIYEEEDSNDKITITWDEDTEKPVLNMDGALFYAASNKLMPCALIGGEQGMSMFSYEVTLSDNTTKTVFPAVYFFEGYDMIGFMYDMEERSPVVICAFAPKEEGKMTVPYVGTYFAEGYKAITATSLMG